MHRLSVFNCWHDGTNGAVEKWEHANQGPMKENEWRQIVIAKINIFKNQTFSVFWAPSVLCNQGKCLDRSPCPRYGTEVSILLACHWAFETVLLHCALINGRSALNIIVFLKEFVAFRNCALVCIKFGMTETWFTVDVTEAFLNLGDFQIFRADRMFARGGGSAIFVHTT